MPRKSLLLSAIAVVLFAVAGYIAAGPINSGPWQKTPDGRQWKITDSLYQAKAEEFGALTVKESITAYFIGSFSGFYRDLPFNQGQQVHQVRAGDQEGEYRPGGNTELGSMDVPRRYGSTELTGRVNRIVWHHSTQDDSRTFKASYRIANLSERFPQADIIRLRVWGKEWKVGAERVRGEVLLPQGVQARKISAGPAWLKPRWGEEGGKVFVTAENLPKQQQLDLLIELPRGSLGKGVTVKEGALPKLPESLGDRVYAKTKSSLARSGLWVAMLILIGILPATVWLLVWKRLMRDPGGSPEVSYDRPNGSLAYGYTAAEESLPDNATAMTAMLIDLIARGHYQRETIKNSQGDWRIKISLNEQRPQEELSSGEAAVRDYIDSLLEQGPCQVDQLAGRVSQSQASKNRIERVYDEIQKDASAALSGQKARGGRLKTAAVIWSLAWLIAIPWITMPAGHAFWIPGNILIGLTAITLIAAIVSWPRKDFVRSNRQAMQLAGPWRNWQKFITGFSSMETAPDLQVDLWERAFAGALMFGVAKPFAQRAEILVPGLPSETTSLAYTSYYSASLASSMSSAATPPSQSSSSSYSGGGFGGGGGGGGGGGAW